MRTEYENAKIDYNSLLTIKVTAEVEKQIVEENARYKLTKAILNPHYLRLLNFLLSKTDPCVMKDYKTAKSLNLQRNLFPDSENPEQTLTPYEVALQQWKFFFTYALTSLLRVTLKSVYPETLRKLRNAAKADVGLSLWLLETFSHPLILGEFLVSCPVSGARFFVASILGAAFGTVFEYEAGRVKKYVENPKLLTTKLLKKGELKPINLLEDSSTDTSKSAPLREAYYLPTTKPGVPHTLLFVNNLLALFPKSLATKQSIPQYTFLLSSLTRNRPEIVKFLLLNGITGLLLEILTELPGEHVAQLGNLKFILLAREPSLGFQRPVANDKDNQHKQIIQVTYARPKHFRFFLELLSTVSNMLESMMMVV